jgi:hypothetical protein
MKHTNFFTARGAYAMIVARRILLHCSCQPLKSKTRERDNSASCLLTDRINFVKFDDAVMLQRFTVI